MTRSSAQLLRIASLLVIGSGAIWAYLRYVHDLGPEPEDPVLAMEWSGVHPWEPSLRNLHLLTAPLLVFAVGVIWSGHVAPRLFRPWARRATGLGLALVKKVFDAHGGTIRCGTSPLGGARFEAELPLSNPEEGAQT